ncbi:MAG: RecX family transcriptional regulator [Chloroflexi bacterium]|nr:RecX family transcriptional regulator [Chloroflexota bacterium]
MAGVITRLVYQKRNHQRVNVYLDDTFAFAVPDIEAARLHVGQHLSDTEIRQLQQLNTEAKAYDRALRLLGHRPRSEQEMRTRLRQAHFEPDVCDQVIERLKDRGYIDDHEFVRWWLENRSQFHPSGRSLLAAELRQKGIDSDTINTALAELDEEALALAAARQRIQRWRQLSQPDFERKMLGFLQRRGFAYAVARSTVVEAWHILHSSSLPSD